MAQRLIDANALKEWLVAQIDYYKKYSGYNCNAMASAYGAILERIDNEPTVDAVAVVRCKDCLYHTDAYPYDEEDELIPSNAVFCRHFEVIRDKNWFCADGERRSE